MRLVMIGRQGSGKGTQCGRIALRLGLVHVSTGDLFRGALAADSVLGRTVDEFVRAGELVPDALAVEVVMEELDRPAVQDSGFVLDGFPRTVCQAEQLAARLAPARIDMALDICVEAEVALRRLLSRRVCSDCGEIAAVGPNSYGDPCSACGGRMERRTDDTEPVIRRRLALYEAETLPLLSWYAAAGMLRTVDGHGPVDVVARRVEGALRANRSEDEGRWALARVRSRLAANPPMVG